jgi:hypothetical protein
LRFALKVEVEGSGLAFLIGVDAAPFGAWTSFRASNLESLEYQPSTLNPQP